MIPKGRKRGGNNESKRGSHAHGSREEARAAEKKKTAARRKVSSLCSVLPERHAEIG